MYEPYVPPTEGSGEAAPCACTQRRLVCTPACERCPADCPDRVALEATGTPAGSATRPVDPPYEPYDATAEAAPRSPTTSTSTSSSPSPRRRRRGSSSGGSSWRRATSRSSGSTSRSSSRSSSGGSSRRSGGKKAGAGIGAAATAAAGGIGALSSGGEDAGATNPDPGHPAYSNHSDHPAYGGGSSRDPYDDRSVVIGEVSVPVVSFTVERGRRLAVVVGAWPGSDVTSDCRAEVTATERDGRVVLEASIPVSVAMVRQGEECAAPTAWATRTSYVELDEPLGQRAVVTGGPLLHGGEEVDPEGTARVPRG